MKRPGIASERSKARCLKKGRLFTGIGFPADCDGSVPCVTLTGTEYALVENHRGLLQLTECCVKLYSCIGIIRVDGRGIRASELDDSAILLQGRIERVSYE